MSNRITLTKDEQKLLSIAITTLLKEDKYHIENSIAVGSIGRDALLRLMGKVCAGEDLQ